MVEAWPEAKTNMGVMPWHFSSFANNQFIQDNSNSINSSAFLSFVKIHDTLKYVQVLDIMISNKSMYIVQSIQVLKPGLSALV